jgi:UDP-4-amino-4-deoxy-L-arabinose-oxoglutarate aminotransferase
MLELGFKANLSDIQAALLIGQLPRLRAQLERREAIARRYQEACASIPGVDYPRVPAGARSARHLFTIWVPPGVRDETISALQARGIGVAVNYRAMHLLSYYQSRFGFVRGTFPNAELIGDRTITLPLYPSMSDEDVEAVIAAIREIAVGWSVSPAEAGMAGARIQ